MHLRRLLVYTVATWLSLGALLTSTNPNKLPVVVFILPFLLLFLAMSCLWRLGDRLLNRQLRIRDRRHHLGSVVCLCGVILLILQSLGQLTLRDVITVAAIIVISYAYFTRIKTGLVHH
jgi:multisubunit Na+/H+ antiporter MnhG subunit